MLPSTSFETGGKTQSQSSEQPQKAASANGSLVLSRIGTAAEKPETRGEESNKICKRAPPKRVGRAFALLTKTYHGSRLIGLAARGSNTSGNGVYLALGQLPDLKCDMFQLCAIGSGGRDELLGRSSFDVFSAYFGIGLRPVWSLIRLRSWLAKNQGSAKSRTISHAGPSRTLYWLRER
jgi:hypothetical protein